MARPQGDGRAKSLFGKIPATDASRVEERESGATDPVAGAGASAALLERTEKLSEKSLIAEDATKQCFAWG